MATYDNIAKPSEHNIQASFFDWLMMFKLRDYPEVHPLFFTVPNGSHLAGNTGQRARQMNKLKKEGLTPGVADTLFLSGRGGYLGLAMEFKTPERKAEKDGGLSESQQEFLRAARMEGWLSAVAYDVEDACDLVDKYLKMPKTQSMIYAALRAAESGNLEGVKRILGEVVLRW